MTHEPEELTVSECERCWRQYYARRKQRATQQRIQRNRRRR